MSSGYLKKERVNKTQSGYMKCPQRHSSNLRKDGHQNGKQRFECKAALVLLATSSVVLRIGRIP